jgi:flagellar biosynthetic protein FliR
MDFVLITTNFFLCFFRFLGVFMVGLLAFTLNLVVFITLPVSVYTTNIQDLNLLIIVAKEFLVGLTMAINVAIVMEVLNFSGAIVSTPMGLSIAQAVDPASGVQSTTIGQFNTTLGTLVFLAVNGHHAVISTFHQSFRFLPIGECALNAAGISWFVQKFYGIFLISLQISGPLLAALIMIKFSLGVLARTMPKFNIFLVGIPVSIVVGMVTYNLTLPFLLKIIIILFERSFPEMIECLKMFM